MTPEEEEKIRAFVTELVGKLSTRNIANGIAHRLENNPTVEEIKAAAIMLRDIAELNERAFKVIEQYQKHFAARRRPS